MRLDLLRLAVRAWVRRMSASDALVIERMREEQRRQREILDGLVGEVRRLQAEIERLTRKEQLKK
jgi:hypothetical protein